MKAPLNGAFKEVEYLPYTTYEQRKFKTSWLIYQMYLLKFDICIAVYEYFDTSYEQQNA